MRFTIETDRILIRPWHEPTDRPAFCAMTADPVMMRYMSDGIPWTDAMNDDFFARQQRHLDAAGVCMGALVQKQTDEVIGVAGLQPLGTTSHLEVGWWVMRAFQGQGIATRAGRMAIHYAFTELDQSGVKAITLPGNLASRRVMEKLGMAYEGIATGKQLGHRLPDLEVVLYGIDRSDALP
ncbi:MAG: GNAT family N-acetyltransferase [Rhodothermales bacterium]|nr:GNAT family N-acetyltransferase [Rhodothermales bacterium]